MRPAEWARLAQLGQPHSADVGSAGGHFRKYLSGDRSLFCDLYDSLEVF